MSDHTRGIYENVKKIETIFNHNLTEEERERFTTAKDKETYFKNKGIVSLDEEHGNIAVLYYMREDWEMYHKYMSMSSSTYVFNKLCSIRLGMLRRLRQEIKKT